MNRVGDGGWPERGMVRKAAGSGRMIKILMGKLLVGRSLPPAQPVRLSSEAIVSEAIASCSRSKLYSSHQSWTL